VSTETEDYGTEAEAVIAITKEAGAGELREIDVHEYYSVLVPDGYSHEMFDLEHKREHPRQAAGTVALTTVDAFVKYVTRHDDPITTTVWVDIDNLFVVGVIDDHAGDAGKPGWGAHRACLALKPTDEWLHWTKADGTLMTQEAFAEHVEDGQVEVVEPDAATLLDIVTTMQGHINAEWKQAIRLQDGTVQFVYNEEATATAGGRGELDIPQTFKLGIRPFPGEEPYAITARLRYRIKSGNLTIGYKLDRPSDVIRDAVEHMAIRLDEQFHDRTFIGRPR